MNYRADHIKVLEFLAKDLPKRASYKITAIAKGSFSDKPDPDRWARNSVRKPCIDGHVEIAERGEYRLTPSGVTFYKKLDTYEVADPSGRKAVKSKKASKKTEKTEAKTEKKASKAEKVEAKVEKKASKVEAKVEKVEKVEAKVEKAEKKASKKTEKTEAKAEKKSETKKTSKGNGIKIPRTKVDEEPEESREVEEGAEALSI